MFRSKMFFFEDESSDEDNEYDELLNLDENEKVEEVNFTDIPSVSEHFQKWLRPELTDFVMERNALTFQQFDIDYYETSDPADSKPVLRLYGVNSNGNSIMAHVHGFFPYVYVEVDHSFNSSDRSMLQTVLTNEIKNQPSYRQMNSPIISVESCMKSSIYEYSGIAKKPFIKITVRLPTLVKACKQILEEGIMMKESRRKFQIFDDIDFSIRYMVDFKMVGCSWVEFPAGSYTIRSNNKVSLCQLEVDVESQNIIYHPIDSQWSDIAPIRILSFSIQYSGRKGVFPNARYDPVIQISNIITRFGDTEPFIKNIFTLNTCAPIVGCHVISHNTEVELLDHWSKFIREVDPDIITGYNIQNFDLPYLIDRAETLNINDFPFLGRVKSLPSEIKDSNFNMGRRKDKMVHMNGRIQFDIFQILQRHYKLRSYSLTAVSINFLKEPKEVISNILITGLQNKDEVSRRRLAQYSLKDSYLVLRLLNKLMCIVNYIEIARVTGLPFSYLLFRESHIQVLPQLLQKAATENYVLPDYTLPERNEYAGATFLFPIPDYYKVPVVKLKFPNCNQRIIMAQNPCFTTFLRCESEIKSLGLSPNDCIKATYGSFFVKSHIKRGLLPEILIDLMEARKMVKRELALEMDPFMKQVLDGRQLALKVSANSVYEFTRAQFGRLPFRAISSYVTTYRREMIELTKREVENTYTIIKGFEHDAKVVYGDSDTVMCKFGVTTVLEAMNLGKSAADYISSKFKSPIELEFEKVYFPYMLINNTKYAGLSYTNLNEYNKIECKGMESIRRDQCPLVSNLVKTCLKEILKNRDDNSAMEYAQSVIGDLLNNRVALSQFIINKKLTMPYNDYKISQPHSEVALKITNRNPGSAPQDGDRVLYIITAGKSKKIYERAEDPVHVAVHNLPIDIDYYYHKQVFKPLLKIFALILHSEEEAVAMLTKEKQKLDKTKKSSNMSQLVRSGFAKEKCLGCSNILTKNEKSLCYRCKPRASTICKKENESLAILKEEFSTLIEQCQKCSGYDDENILCRSRDCPIFYKWNKGQKELNEKGQILKKFYKDFSW